METDTSTIPDEAIEAVTQHLFGHALATLYEADDEKQREVRSEVSTALAAAAPSLIAAERKRIAAEIRHHRNDLEDAPAEYGPSETTRGMILSHYEEMERIARTSHRT